MAINKDGIDTYWRVRLTCTPEQVEPYSLCLEELFGSLTAFEVEEHVEWRVDAFSETEPDHQLVAKAIQFAAGLMECDPPEMEAEELPHKDWLTENLQTFPPIDIGRFYIYGSHVEEKVPGGKLGLQVDAGGAFGSGEHATTAGCLTAIDKLAKSHTFRRPLDMGCGTGILGMAAAKVWQVPVLGVDIDERSVTIANENAKLNGLAGSFEAGAFHALTADGYKDRRIKRAGPYDFVVSNILARPLCAMAKDLHKNLQPGGWVVLSGLLTKDGNRVVEAHRRMGLRLVEKICIDNWLTLILKG